ncbi:MAG: BamA/TamA family outer membrane protein [Bacteroidota bacterium]
MKERMKRAWLIGFLSCGLSTTVEARTLADSGLVVAKIVVIGNEITKDHVILREMSLKVGGPLTATSIEFDQKRVYSLQLFNSVEIDYTAEGDQTTVFVRVSERWYIFPIPILGFKYRDTKKFFYGLGVIHQNFRGRNEKILGSFALGFDRWISLAYQNPKLTADDDIFIGGRVSYSHVQNQNVSQGLYNQRVFGANTTLGKRFGLYTTVLGVLGYDHWDISDPQEGRTASHAGIDEFLSLGLRYTLDTRDVREYPTAGYVTLFSATKLGFGDSEVDLFRYRVDLRGYQPLGNDVALCGRMFGSFLSGGVVPAYLHAYFGYDERLRGYFNTVFEGEDIVGSSLELRVPILKPRYLRVSTPLLPPEFSLWRYGLYAGFFADAGKVWYRTESFNQMPWRSGYGAGLHFLLPYSIVVRTEYALNNLGRWDFVLDLEASF